MAAGGGAMSFRFTGRSAASKNLLAHTRTKICEEEDDGEGTGGAKDYVLSLEGREIQRLVGIEPYTPHNSSVGRILYCIRYDYMCM